jgi:hypothetical protein
MVTITIIVRYAILRYALLKNMRDDRLNLRMNTINKIGLLLMIASAPYLLNSNGGEGIIILIVWIVGCGLFGMDLSESDGKMNEH